MSANGVRIIPNDVYIGTPIKQKEKITVPVNTYSSAAMLDSKYFIVVTPAGVKHYFWFDSGAGTDPAIAGFTGHDIAWTPSGSVTATTIAGLINSEFTTIFGAAMTNSTALNVVNAEWVATGYTPPMRNGSASAGLGFEVVNIGQSEYLVGCIDGEITIKPATPEKKEIKCHQTGSTVQGEIITGFAKPELSFTLQDTSKEALKQAFIYSGSNTYISNSGYEIMGQGQGLLGKSNQLYRVRLHPVAKGNDKSEDLTAWTCSISFDQLNFSGEDFSKIPLKFSVYPDYTKNTEIQFFMYGDNSTI